MNKKEQKLKNLALEMVKIYNPKTAFGDRKLIELGRETKIIYESKEESLACDDCDENGMIECPECGGDGYTECEHYGASED